MNNQFDTVNELNLDDYIVGDLLDSEVLLIGGGEIVGNTY
jgi:hypothetical protein